MIDPAAEGGREFARDWGFEPPDPLREAAEAVLVALGWPDALKIGYEGTSGDVEDFEIALHDLSAALSEKGKTHE